MKTTHKLLNREWLIAKIALACGVIVTNVMATSIPQTMAQRMPRAIILAQSAVDEDSNVKFEPRGCRRTKATQVNCDVLITNLGNTRQGLKFGVYGNATNAIDPSGTVYGAKRVQSGESFADVNGSNGTVCGCFSISIASGIPTKVTFTFEIPQEVTELAALDVDYASSNGGKRIAISNIGTIASQSNSAPPRQRVRPR